MNRQWFRSLAVAAFIAALMFTANPVAQSARHAITNLLGYTDGVGNLMVAAMSAQGVSSGRRAIGNLLGRTDASGNLMVALSTMQVGTGTATAAPNGTLTTSTTTAQTAADTVETTLWTYSLPANTLSANGKGVRIVAWGTTGATANGKTIKLYFGGTTLVTAGNALNNGQWKVNGLVLRSGAATQVGTADLVFGGWAGAAATATAPAETLSGAVTIRVTGTNGTAAAGDIVFKGAVVEAVGSSF
jgi:hypothetical protein